VPQPPLTACAARWCQHAARRVAQDVEAAALRERRLQEQLDESHDVRPLSHSRTAGRAARRAGRLTRSGARAGAHSPAAIELGAHPNALRCGDGGGWADGQEIQSLRASKATVEHSLRQSLQARAL
jgi:hypothetical protein